MIVKNYSGDCMNFNNAAALAKEDGVEVDAVYVNDDIAVKDSLYTVGRRGVAGTVFVHKIAGAKAEQGGSLQEVKAVAQKVIDNVRSFGFALTSCTVPAAGSPTFEIGEDEMEFGVGIHGEPGRKRENKGFTVVPFGQGMASLSFPTKELLRLVLKHQIAHGGNVPLRWMIDNVVVKKDSAGNIKMDKEKSIERIDGAVALVMALDRAIRCGNDNKESIYNDRGIIVL